MIVARGDVTRWISPSVVIRSKAGLSMRPSAPQDLTYLAIEAWLSVHQDLERSRGHAESPANQAIIL